MERYHIGVDIGGTFTDIVIFDSYTGSMDVLKIPSTPEPENAVIEALSNLRIGRDEIGIINHATTVATNALLTKSKIPKAALITNRGFRDVLEIGRQRRSEIYNLYFTRPRPLIPRKYRYTVKGRVLYDGSIYQELDYEELKRIKKRILAEKIETIAVSMLNSYVNPSQEKEIKEFFSDFKGKIFISSEVDPQYREYERTSTTVVNAILSPIVSSYLDKLSNGIISLGIRSPIYVMGSNGGLNTISFASRMPISIIESGPGAGVMASLSLAKKLGIENVITFDMGGTTAKAGAIVKGEVEISNEFEAAGKTHSGRSIKGSGYPVRYPFIDLAEVSAGGGTIARVDEGGLLKVGPESAGSFPGPAAYNRGGTEPTVTDANIVLGRINQEYLLGGGMKIYPELSWKAIEEKVAEKLSMDAVEASKGIIRIVNNAMSRAISIVSIERGRDPRDFTMFSFGGAGPLHSCDLAEEIGIREIVVPRNPGLFSAFGLLTVDISRVFVSQFFGKGIEESFISLEKRALDSFEGENLGPIELRRYVDMRYMGQSYEITLEYKKEHDLYESFREEHKRLYGFYSDDPVEIVNLRLIATARVPKADMKKVDGIKTEPRVYRRNVIFLDESTETPVYIRETLPPGFEGSGPAIIEGYDSTVVVNPGWEWSVDPYLNIILRR
ncbi:MAG: hydantoinase/oxoprolinase family protein [Thermoplasmata archaeon]